jgi:hypothetical protein
LMKSLNLTFKTASQWPAYKFPDHYQWQEV